MKAPGTAYDDPVLGKDPQPADMDGYVDLPHDDQHDNGGVHINSGIPNHAFYLAATALGGNAWERPARSGTTSSPAPGLAKDIGFAGFATATVDAATTGSARTAAAARAVRAGVAGGEGAQLTLPGRGSEAEALQLLGVALPVLGDLDVQVEVDPLAEQRLDPPAGVGADLAQPRRRPGR